MANRILLIGNGPSALKAPMGSVIDGFDGVVARFNEFRTKGYEAFLGSRTDEWITWRVFPLQGERDYERVLATTQPPATTWPEILARYSHARRVSNEAVQECRRRMSHQLPSSGAMSAMHYILQGWDVTLWGFDFFQGPRHHYADDGTIGDNHSPEHELRLFRQLLEERLVRELLPADADEGGQACARLIESSQRAAQDGNAAARQSADRLSADSSSGDAAALEARCEERLDALQRRDHQAAQHLARYEWAASAISGRRVLDCACGLGYGSAILSARGAAEVLGADVSADAIASARATYAGDDVSFIQSDGYDLDPVKLGSFDAIVCLETLEHVADPQRLLDVFKRLLTPTGLLLISVPNDRLLGAANPFHLWLARQEEVRSWLASRFAHVSDYAEAHVVGASVWPAHDAAGDPDGFLWPTSVRRVDTLETREATDFLFACSDAPLAPIAPIGAHLLGGFDYVRELETKVRDLWAELRTVADRLDQVTGHNAEVSTLLEDTRQHVSRLERERDAAVQERDRALGIVPALTAERDDAVTGRQQAEAECVRNGLRAERAERERDELSAVSQRLTSAWGEQVDRLAAAERARDEAVTALAAASKEAERLRLQLQALDLHIERRERGAVFRVLAATGLVVPVRRSVRDNGQ